MIYLKVNWEEEITRQYKQEKHGKDHKDTKSCPCCWMTLSARIKAIHKEILEGRAIIKDE
jgi:hypothetical protein